MKLLPSAWMTLNEILSWLVNQGMPTEDAKKELIRRFDHGDIRTRGRRTLGSDHEHLQLQARDWVAINIDWDQNRAPFDGFINSTFEFTDGHIHDIEAFRDELFKCFGWDPTAPAIPAQEPLKNRGGAPPKYDWEAFYLEISIIADLDGLPDTQADLERLMADWCLNLWRKEPSSSRLKAKISKIYNDPRKRAPE